MTPTTPKPTPALLACLRCGGEITVYRHDLRRGSASTPGELAYNWRCKDCNLSNCFPFAGEGGMDNAIADANRRPPLPVEGAPNPPRCPDCLNFHWKESPRTCGVEAPAAGEVEGEAPDLEASLRWLEENEYSDEYPWKFSHHQATIDAMKARYSGIAGFRVAQAYREVSGRLSALLNGKGRTVADAAGLKIAIDAVFSRDFSNIDKEGALEVMAEEILRLHRLSEENKGEPVAWMDPSDGRVLSKTDKDIIEALPNKCEEDAIDNFTVPLYAAPVSMPRLWDADTIKDAPEGEYVVGFYANDIFLWGSAQPLARAAGMLDARSCDRAFGPIPQPPAAPVKGA